MNGLRVKLTYTFSAAGTMAPIFISVLGLTERELLEDERIALKIEGLSVGGGGVTVGTKQCGFLLLMRGQKGSDKKDIISTVIIFSYLLFSRVELNLVVGKMAPQFHTI